MCPCCKYKVVLQQETRIPLEFRDRVSVERIKKAIEWTAAESTRDSFLIMPVCDWKHHITFPG